MIIKTGERWHCTNPACHCSVLVEKSGEIEGRNLQCTCGSAMKKVYSPPVIRYLDFLRFEQPAVIRRSSDEE